LPVFAFADENETKTTTVTVTGTVQSYEPGRTITVVGDNGEATTYTINESSHLPKTVTVGKTVTVHTTSISGSPVVQTVISASKSAQRLANVPAKIVVLTAEEIRLRGYVGFDEIFHDLAGMDVSQGRGVEWTTIFMRGIRTENTDRFLLIWDGVIQNDIW